MLTDSVCEIFLRCQRALQRIYESNGDVDAAEEASLQQQMNASLIHLVTIPIGMGLASTALPVKFAALMWQMKVSFAADADWDQVKAICDRVVSVTTDYGTEAGLGLVPDAVSPDTLYPH